MLPGRGRAVIGRTGRLRGGESQGPWLPWQSQDVASSVPATMGLAGSPTVQRNEVASGRLAVADPR